MFVEKFNCGPSVNAVMLAIVCVGSVEALRETFMNKEIPVGKLSLTAIVMLM